MSNMTLEALRARHGDALILTADGATVLIDGGAGGVYQDVLRARLASMDNGGDSPPVVDLMMLSHIDDDHINGLLDLTSELKEADEDEERRLIDITEAWHNSFADAIASTGLAKPKQIREQAMQAASMLGSDAFLSLQMPDAGMSIASVGQGRRLRSDLSALKIDTNKGFDNGLVLADAAGKPWQRGALTLTVIGPGKTELEKLKKAWAKQLPKILAKEAAKKADIQAAAGALDKSVFNLASIVVIAEAGGKTILLTGDARGDMILDWLDAAGHTGGKAHFNVLKVPHHGSDRNVSIDFFSKVTADHYVISGDGNHGNPEPEMLEMLFVARGQSDYTIHMTYGPQQVAGHSRFHQAGELHKVLNKEDWRRQRLVFPSGNEQSVIVEV